MTLTINIVACCFGCTVVNKLAKLVMGWMIIHHPELSDAKVRFLTNMFRVQS